jgi:hypothetical protein
MLKFIVVVCVIVIGVGLWSFMRAAQADLCDELDLITPDVDDPKEGI